MDSPDFELSAISAVLLADGWHYVAHGSSVERVHASVTTGEAQWFRFFEQLPASTYRSGGQEIIAGPFSSILAVRLKQGLSGR